MIGRLVLSDRNIFKIKSGTKQVSARKCYVLSEPIDNVLIKTSKEFNPKDEYIKFDPETNTIIQSYGSVGNLKSDLEIYFHMYTLNWMSESKYSKLWDLYLYNKQGELTDFDLVKNIRPDNLGINRVLYSNQVITIDPINSIDLDDGFSFNSDSLHYWLDIHIADPVSWFDLTNPVCKEIFKEIYTRQQSCYISQLNVDSHGNPINKPTHLLPPKVVQIISLLELNNFGNQNQTKSRRAISFCFKISKQTKSLEHFELKFTNLTNIKNYSYETYDQEINNQNNIGIKSELVGLSNIIINIIGLGATRGFEPISINMDISHKMIEIFMILTNWYGGNYLINNIGWNKTILRTQMASEFDDLFDITKVPEWARVILSKSANYKFADFETNAGGENLNAHYSLGITNYSHVSSPMRRFVDMLNHLGLYCIEPSAFLQDDFNPWNLEYINKTVKNQKKISNGYDLLYLIKKTNSIKFKACLFDYLELPNGRGIKSTLVLSKDFSPNFIRVINVELPETELTCLDKISKYMEFDIELYYNPNNFKSSKFPFSIKIV